MRKRIFVKLMFVLLLVIGVTAITLQLTVRRVWERTLREQIERNLKEKTLMFAHRVDADRQRSLADIAAQEGQAAGGQGEGSAGPELGRVNGGAQRARGLRGEALGPDQRQPEPSGAVLRLLAQFVQERSITHPRQRRRGRPWKCGIAPRSTATGRRVVDSCSRPRSRC